EYMDFWEDCTCIQQLIANCRYVLEAAAVRGITAYSDVAADVWKCFWNTLRELSAFSSLFRDFLDDDRRQEAIKSLAGYLYSRINLTRNIRLRRLLEREYQNPDGGLIAQCYDQAFRLAAEYLEHFQFPDIDALVTSAARDIERGLRHEYTAGSKLELSHSIDP